MFAYREHCSCGTNSSLQKETRFELDKVLSNKQFFLRSYFFFDTIQMAESSRRCRRRKGEEEEENGELISNLIIMLLYRVLSVISYIIAPCQFRIIARQEPSTNLGILRKQTHFQLATININMYLIWVFLLFTLGYFTKIYPISVLSILFIHTVQQNSKRILGP